MFDERKIVTETIQQVINHLSFIYLRMAWSGAPAHDQVIWMQWIESSPAREEIKLLVAVANGEVTRDDRVSGEIVETIQSVVELLFSVPGSYTYNIPDDFWSSDLGRVVRYCQVWTRGDDLISHGEAAQILYGANNERELMRIRRLIERGELIAYEDPREPNPRHAQRVSRREVLKLKN